MFLKNLFGSSEDKIRPKLIQYSFDNNTSLVHKEGGYPILQDSQLIVGPSQTVVMVRNGQIYKTFESGAQVLDTGVLQSILKKYEKAYDGGELGIPVDLYFINNLFSDILPWGTPDPIQIIDPVLDIFIKIVANGQLRYQIVDPELYIITNMTQDVANLNRICKQKVISAFASAVQNYANTEKLGYFELAGQIVKISDRIKDLLNAKLVGEEGFRIVEFTIGGFHADDDDLAMLQETKNDVMRMKREAEARAYARSIEGYTYQEERQFDVMKDAAGNTGALGGAMGTMIGATLGASMGSAMSGMVSPAMTPPAGSAASSGSGTSHCVSCGKELPAGAKFCSGCGTPVAPPEKFCINCGTKLSAEAMFCHSCGAKQS